MTMKLASIVFSSWLLCLGSAQARAPGGDASKALGPNGAGSVEGTRTVNGPKAASSFSASGPKGYGLSGSASSTAAGGKGSGSATLQTTGGKSMALEGTGQITPQGASGHASVTTGNGKTATGSATASKTDSGMSASGAVTTGSGKTLNAAVAGNKDGGTATLSSGQGSKTVNYGNQRP